jgi:hypothetical protein
MKHTIYILILLLSINFSCRDIYDPNTDSSQGILVVEGLITDQPGPYTIHLTQAMPYDTIQTVNGTPVQKANVYITDNYANKYSFTESDAGYYVSKASGFTGYPGVTYTLHIRTTDGNIYESTPQKIPFNSYNDTIYYEYSSKDTYTDYKKTTTNGLYLLTDITNTSDNEPYFRFRSTIYTEWLFSMWDAWEIEPPTVNYYGWSTSDPTGDQINLTLGKYSTATSNIIKHPVCFISTDLGIYSANLPLIDTVVNFQYDPSMGYPHNPRYSPTYPYPQGLPRHVEKGRDSVIHIPAYNRIIKIEQYRINDETYQYYNNINSLTSANDKIFSPGVLQLKGNITCTNNSAKLALGMFEASALRIKTYSIKPHPAGTSTIVRQPNIWPPTNQGYKADTIMVTPTSVFYKHWIGSHPNDISIKPAFWVD